MAYGGDSWESEDAVVADANVEARVGLCVTVDEGVAPWRKAPRSPVGIATWIAESPILHDR